ncbi:heavy metal translocating P-type ATPase [sulfur-oxidizing endosymbiont of Gigantopelta aegis]|uniref:heavy metal translocating P-type ATPase n=1 Tax=sulfur-oxidizing endosymbiont of Gigantopelta aegis TaxID=2794934 RepID=UPI0018DC593C|nr:heavy metal translocating P-type ATPase [sulfur-oxidizing endosymbiont of Gigantopelta aegis]
MSENQTKSYSIGIEDMTCEHCVASVSKAALAISNVESIDVDLENSLARIKGGLPHEVIEAITLAGYPAHPIADIPESCDINGSDDSKTVSNRMNITPNVNDVSIPYIINIEDMTCSSCVSSVEKAILSVSGVSDVAVNLLEHIAQVHGGSATEVVNAIIDQGYNASIKEQTKSTQSNHYYAILIEDMTCSSCVSSVEKAIMSVSGVIEGSVNLLEKTAQILGGEPQSVINAIIDQGYDAHLIEQKKTSNAYQIILKNVQNEKEFTLLKDKVNACFSSYIKTSSADEKADISELNFLDSNFLDSKNDITVKITSTLHPAKLLVILKNAGIDATINEQYENPYFEQARKTKIEIRKSWQRAIWAGSVGATLMTAEHFNWFPELSSNTQFYGISTQLFWFIVALVCLFTMWFSGRNYYITAVKQAKHLSSNMDTLVALGTSAAWLSSLLIIIDPEFIPGGGHLYLDAGVIILAFLQFGHALEVKAKRTTSESIASIVELAPKTATIIYENSDVTLPVSLLQMGDLIKVKPGERIAIDGSIVEGSSTVDESMLTGEPLAVKKSIDDKVTGGTINKSGSFIFAVNKMGDDTTLSQIINMVKQAQMTKPAIGRMVDKIASVFVPIVIVVSISTFFIWFFVGPEPQLAYALTAGIAVLVIACPCALGLATPIAIMMGTSKAAQLNILIKNSDALQTASTLTHIVVDKTGTLTQGRPTVTKIIVNPDLEDTKDDLQEFDENSLLQLAASLETNSEHPLAEAILKASDERCIALLDIDSFLAVEGRGVQAIVKNSNIQLGNLAFMLDNKVKVSEELQSQAEKLAESSATPIWLASEQQLLGLIALKDPIRADTPAAIANLKQKNIKVVMCSGDSHKTAQAVADELGIEEVHSQVMPEDKLKIVKALQAEGFLVGMVGDGVNDAPALAQANTGFAIGSGTDVAIENSDITLAGNSLMNVGTAIAISTATIRNIKQNLFGAFIYNVIGIPLAAGVFYPLTGWLLAPAFASAAMAMSSVTVVANANRLRFFKP